mmetsp:Transcript_14794/g.29987  ORF Transcript_14794/g.29987 Transcript_14794/m.29987 type:complete len:159 (-) Transcript_14794:2172-2648(-)
MFSCLPRFSLCPSVSPDILLCTLPTFFVSPPFFSLFFSFFLVFIVFHFSFFSFFVFIIHARLLLYLVSLVFYPSPHPCTMVYRSMQPRKENTVPRTSTPQSKKNLEKKDNNQRANNNKKNKKKTKMKEESNERERTLFFFFRLEKKKSLFIGSRHPPA